MRWFDYSTFGSDTTSKFGLNWRPVQDLLVRGTWGEGFRAPGIGELFGTFSRFDQTLTDPCSGASRAANVANCTALGVPPTFAQFNAQISVITGGNPDLKPETSESYTAGIVYSPRWAEGASWSDSLSLELTYYNIKIDNTIQARDAQAQLDGCVATLDAVLCNGITRTSGGVINGFHNTLINIGGTETAGYDLNMRWVMPGDGYRKIHCELAEHLARQVHREHRDRDRLRGHGSQGNGARQPVAGVSGMEVRAVA